MWGDNCMIHVGHREREYACEEPYFPQHDNSLNNDMQR